MAKLDFMLGHAGADIHVEPRLEQRMLFLPLHQQVEVHARIFRVQHRIDGGGGMLAQGVHRANAQLHRAIAHNRAREQPPHRAKLGCLVGIDIPVVPISGHVFAQIQRAQRLAACPAQFPSIGPLIPQGSNIAAFVELNNIQRRFHAGCVRRNLKGAFHIRPTGSERERLHRQRLQRHAHAGDLRAAQRIRIALERCVPDGHSFVRQDDGVAARVRKRVRQRHMPAALQRSGRIVCVLPLKRAQSILLAKQFCGDQPLQDIAPCVRPRTLDNARHFPAGALVDAGDRRARQNVVELVLQQNLV